MAHGPNLNLLGLREPEIYGAQTLSEIDDTLRVRGQQLGLSLAFIQSNHEGVLVDRLQAALNDETEGVLINPAGLTHTSVVLRDTVLVLRARSIPVVEVHLSAPEARESFRHFSYLADVVSGRISGLGSLGYELGLNALSQLLTAT